MDIIIKIVIFVVAFFLGALVAAIFATARRKGLEEKIASMRNCSRRQDEAIRQKQVRIANLEKEIRRMRRQDEG